MSIVLANLLSILILASFVWGRWVRTRSLLEPGIVFALNLIVLYPIRALVLLIFGDASLPDYPGASSPENLEWSSWLATLGCVGFVSGYGLLIGPRRLVVLDGMHSTGRADDVLVCFVFFAAALMGIAYKIATGDYISYLISDTRIGGLTQVGNVLISFEWPAFIGVWVLWFRGLRTPRFIALFLLVQSVVIPFQFIQGSKTYLSLLLVSVIVAYYWCRGTLPKTFVAIALVLVVFFIFPYVQGFRETINTAYGGVPAVSNLKVEEIASISSDAADPISMEERLLLVSARYGGIDHLYGITQTVPSLLPYRYGSEYSVVALNLVPRLLWPDKPTFSRGAEYGAALNTITSITPFPFGEAYWDMGVLGLLLMMMFWGACLAGLIRVYTRFYRKPALSFFVATYFLSQIYWIAGGESSMPVVISSIPQQLAILGALYIGLRLMKGLARITRTPNLVKVQ